MKTVYTGAGKVPQQVYLSIQKVSYLPVTKCTFSYICLHFCIPSASTLNSYSYDPLI